MAHRLTLKVKPNKQHGTDKSKSKQQPETSKITQETKKKTNTENKKHSPKRPESHSKRQLTVSLPRPSQSTYLCNYLRIPQVTPMVMPMSMYYPQNYNFPIAVNRWNPIIPIQTPLYSVQPVPVVINPAQAIARQIVPFMRPQPFQPLVTPIFADISVSEHESLYATEQSEFSQCVTKQILNYTEINTSEETKVWKDETINQHCDCIEFYITLPKELFPTARMLTLDPNPIIDEFCKIPNVQQHTPWLLDLEYGVPRTPIARPIPIYNVKFNRIDCMNTPEAMHPGFENCNQDFQRVLMFYYDCIISAWYRGYRVLNDDSSVENFQSWLLLPMQVLGMCWP